MKMKKGSVVIYVLALMLVTAGYWAYLSNETKTIETVSSENQNTTDEHLGEHLLIVMMLQMRLLIIRKKRMKLTRQQLLLKQQKQMTIFKNPNYREIQCIHKH